MLPYPNSGECPMNPPPSPPFDSVDSPPSAAAGGKRKRSNVSRFPSIGRGGGSGGGEPASHRCSVCGKPFSSWKALFGHMRCHPERQWRGINPPPNLLRQPSPPRPRRLSEEEQEAAACLVLMANGHHHATPPEPAEPLECRFECSCCKKVFGSHQALGGHRATHKTVKGCFAAKEDEDPDGAGCGGGDPLAGEEEKGHHICTICSKAFPSGQALGGHKRCHWERVDEPSMTRGCAVDLNLPATPENESTSSELVLDLRLGG